MKVGFTGTQHGMNDGQKYMLKLELIRLNATELHHGDCIGADAEAHEIAVELGLNIVIHPPENNSKRAWMNVNEGVILLPTRPYLERNKDIVNKTDLLIAGVQQNEEKLRSGTWSTVRYARRVGKEVFILARRITK